MWWSVDSSQVLGVLVFLHHNIFGERLEPFAVGLDDGNRHRASFADLYVSCGSGFSGVSAANDFAEVAVSYCRLFWIIHFLTSYGLLAE